MLQIFVAHGTCLGALATQPKTQNMSWTAKRKQEDDDTIPIGFEDLMDDYNPPVATTTPAEADDDDVMIVASPNQIVAPAPKAMVTVKPLPTTNTSITNNSKPVTPPPIVARNNSFSTNTTTTTALPQANNTAETEALKKRILDLEEQNKILKSELKQFKSHKENEAIDDYFLSMSAPMPAKQKGSETFEDLMDASTQLTLKVYKAFKETDFTKACFGANARSYFAQNKNQEEDKCTLSLKDMYAFDKFKLEQTERKDGMCMLPLMKALDQKCHLLDTFMDQYSGCSEHILPILLHMENTLDFSIFMSVLSSRDIPKRIYIRWLRQNMDWDNLFRVYKYFNMSDQAHLVKLEIAMRTDPKLHALKMFDRLEKCLMDIQVATNMNMEERNFQATLVQQQINLVSRQIKVEEHDHAIALKKTEPMYDMHPRRNIVGACVQDFLYYCFLYHPFAELGKLSSPKSLRQDFSLSDKRYHYTALLARTKCRDWPSIKGLFEKLYGAQPPTTSSSFFGSLKTLISGGSKTYDVPIDIFILVVASEQNPPLDLVQFMLQYCTVASFKYQVAMKLKLYKLAIACLMEMRDRLLMVSLRDFIDKKYVGIDSEELLMTIDNALYKSKVKWN